MAKHHKNGASENSKTPRRRITGSALALQSCKARAKINRKMRNSTPCKIVPRENFILQLCTRDDVGAFTRYANFGFNQYNGGFSSNRRLVPFFWLSCFALSCSYLFLDPTPRSNRWKDFHALLLVSAQGWSFWWWVTIFGEMCHKTSKKCSWIGNFQPKRQNIKITISPRNQHQKCNWWIG